MANEPLTESQLREVKMVAKIEVREYFDYYLKSVLPAQESAWHARTKIELKLHDADPKAHSSVERRLSRLVWIVVGAASVGGGVGAGVVKLMLGLV